MYRRWLDIRASVRGRGHVRGAVEAEEKRLKSGWPELLKSVIQDIKDCRSQQEAEAASQPDDASAALEDDAMVTATIEREAEAFDEETEDAKNEVFQDIGQLLQPRSLHISIRMKATIVSIIPAQPVNGVSPSSTTRTRPKALNATNTSRVLDKDSLY